jgi:amino acid transporter
VTSQLSAAKRILVGPPLPNENLEQTLLPKRIALPIFASDPLSSVAYATEAILKVLAVGGLAYLYLTPWIAAAVVVLLVTVVVSYRQVVMAYPSGGGSYEVVRDNLGQRGAMIVAASLMVDYVMTVAVSVAAGVDNVISALPDLNPHRVTIAVGLIAGLTVMNLRGTRESGRAFAVPTYVFVACMLAVSGFGITKALLGDAPVAESAGYSVRPEQSGLTGLALLFLALKAFSSGCTALTGVEAISNGVPAFRAPKSRNAARTLVVMGALAVAMFSGITILAIVAKVHVAEESCDLIGFPGDCSEDPQQTVIAQLAAAVFGPGSLMFYLVQASTALVLILAANTAFNGFPTLASLLAQHRLMPTQLRTRGDRLAYSNGILALALVAGLLVVAYRADVDQLLHLYILGVFTSFTLSQAGMVRHWNRELQRVIAPGVRRRINGARLVNGFGASLTGLVLLIVLVTKFTGGAYLVVIAVPLLCLLMRGVNRHYARVVKELIPSRTARLLPSRVHAAVLVSSVNQPALRAIAYARATRPSSLTALTVCVDPEEAPTIENDWAEANLPVPLTLLDSPFRDITTPVVQYVLRLRSDNPRDLIVVFLPEYVVDRWWEGLLHNQSALRLKLRLLNMPGVVMTSVPYHLRPDATHHTESPALQRTTAD